MHPTKSPTHLSFIILVLMLAAVLSGCSSGQRHVRYNQEYYYVLYDSPHGTRKYAVRLTQFIDRLLHDKKSFAIELPANMKNQFITHLASPDGLLQIYTWHDGDIGSTLCFKTLYQTNRGGEYHAELMNYYCLEPRKIYQMESPDGPVYLFQYFFREGGWTYFIGVSAFTISETGLLQPAKIFECIPETHPGEEGFSSDLSVMCAPVPPSLYHNGGWWDRFYFFGLTGNELYMPHFIKQKVPDGPNKGVFMSDFYHRFVWDGEIFHYKQMEYNPVLAKQMPEPGWLMEEFEWGDSIVRIDSIANGSYRYIVWEKDSLFKTVPNRIIHDGQYIEAQHEYFFKDGGYEYFFNIPDQRLQILYTDPETRKRTGIVNFKTNE